MKAIDSGGQKYIEDEKEPICCVCGHKLANHLKEGKKWWRCHSLAGDFYQCECRLHDFGEGIEEYNLQKRVNEQLKDLRGKP